MRISIIGLLLLLVGQVQAQQPPNIILIVADDMSFGDVWRTPHPVQAKMVNLNSRFRNQGTLLHRYFAAAPVCSPSRWGMLTGRNPAVDGIRTSIDGTTTFNAFVGIPAGTPTIYSVLQGAGFATGHFGKWHLGLDPSLSSVADYGIGTYEGWEYPTGGPGGLVGQRFVTAWGGGSTAEKLSAYGQFDDLATDAAISFIQASSNSGTPFFCNVSFHSPHYPVNPPISSLTAVDTLKDSYGRPSPAQIYYAAIHRLDYNVGRLFSTLNTSGTLNNTIVIFTADNGGGISDSAVNSSDQWGRERNFRGQKGEVSNGALCVPFGIRGPGIPAMLELKNATVSGLDLAPTLCAMVGVTWTGAGQGEDRSAVFTGADSERTTNIFALSTQGDAATLDAPNRFPAFQMFDAASRVSVFMNLDAMNQPKDLAIYQVGLNASGREVDPAQMLNLADSRMRQPDGTPLLDGYAAEVESLRSWAEGLGTIPWIDPSSHGELSPDD